jgi:hypothetical protein
MRTQQLLPIAAVVMTSAAAFAQTSRSPATPVTVTGCIQKETDYRKAHNLGKGGTLQTGAGSGDEYVLINASKGSAPAANIDCSFQSGTDAYELTGKREHDLKPFVGKVVQITGTMKEAKTRTAPSGEQVPTGGFDPLKKDLRLFEVEVASFQTPAAPLASAQPAPAREPAPARVPEAAAPQPEQPQQVARANTELPKTASPLALSGLVGLLSLAGAFGVRRVRSK